MKRLILISFLFLLFCLSASAQTIPHLQYGVEDGLGNSIVYSAFQDSKGYMWFSTDHGLSKFDGVHFTNYTTADGLPTNYILSVTETRDGILYIGTYGHGICIYKNGVFKQIHLSGNIFLKNAINVVADKSNRIWVFTGVMNVGYIENNSYHIFRIGDYLKDTLHYILYDLIVRHNGTVLLGTDKGAFLLDGGRLDHLMNTDFPIYKINEDDLGDLWFGSQGKIIERTHDDKARIIYNEFIKSDQNVQTFLVDQEDRLWVDDYPHSFFVVNSTTGKTIYKTKVPITSFYIDKCNNIWATTFGQGIFCFAYPDIINYTVKDGLSDNVIQGVSEDSKGKVWVASHTGISYIIGNDAAKHEDLKVTQQGQVFGIMAYSNDELLFGMDGYLDVRKNGMLKQFPIKGRIRSLYKGDGDKIWIAMDAGILYYHNDSVFESKELSALKGVENYAVMVDSKGQLWSATNNGAYCYDRKMLHHYTSENGLSDNRVNGIWEDADKRMWFVTDEGVSILDKGIWLKDSMLKAVSNIKCTSIIGDSTGNIWIGSNNGLFLYDGKIIKPFDSHTGIAGIEIQSLYLDSKNRLWVGTITGLSRINLSVHYRLNDSYPPEIYIQGVKVNNEVIRKWDSDLLALKYYENDITINYTGVCFKDPSALYYEYKLDGESRTWKKTKYNSVEFSPLMPGNYKFNVRAVNADGVYSRIPVVFSFTILPPYWKRLWFILSEIVLGITIVSIMFRWRLAVLKKRTLLKEELNNAKRALGDYTRSMAEKNELLEQFKKDIENLEKLKSNDLDELKNKQLEHLNTTTILTKDDWDKFKRLFDQVHKGYLIRLKEKLPELTQAEIRLICLTKLELDTKQMAGILGLSYNSIKQKRYELRKKLGLSKEDGIDDIATSI